MKILESSILKRFIRMGMDGNHNGWHERNGGNLTYRLSNDDLKDIKDEFVQSNDWKKIGALVPKLASEFFLTSGSGKFFRNFEIEPEEAIGIIEIDLAGENYRICWGLKNGGLPTSELPTHLMNHEIKKQLTNDKHRVIYHAHTTNLIALTFVLPLDYRVFTRHLWEMATECLVVFPEGVGIVDWMVPGGRKIAVATSELMKSFNAVIWAHHGLFCSGENFDVTFGLMHTIEKSAEILVKVLSMSPSKLQTITTDNLCELAHDFKISLPEEIIKFPLK